MNRYIPNQHGAWAMLILPFLLGLAVTGGRLIHIPLFIGWLCIYLFSFPVLQWIKTGKRDRYVKPALLYGALLLPVLIFLIWYGPALIGYGAVLLLSFLPNIYFAKTKNERALVNDILAIAVFCSFIYPVVYVGGGSDWRATTQLFVLMVVYFIGTALYVKTVIREKNNPKYYLASVIYHFIYIGIAASINIYLIIPTIVLLLRAAILPKLGIKAKQSGIAEIGFSLMLYVSVLVFFF